MNREKYFLFSIIIQYLAQHWQWFDMEFLRFRPYPTFADIHSIFYFQLLFNILPNIDNDSIWSFWDLDHIRLLLIYTPVHLNRENIFCFQLLISQKILHGFTSIAFIWILNFTYTIISGQKNQQLSYEGDHEAHFLYILTRGRSLALKITWQWINTSFWRDIV